MQVGDLIQYEGLKTGAVYICVELIGKVYCRLHGFPENQVFKIECLRVVSKCR